MNTLSRNQEPPEIESPLALRKPARTPEVLQRITAEQSEGMLVRAVVLDNERSENFAMLINDYSQAIPGDTEVERGMIEEIAAANWRMRRCWALETRLLNAHMPDDQVSDFAPGPDPSDNDVYVQEMNRQADSFRKLAERADFK